MSEPWRHRAACGGQDTSWWFPDKTGAHNATTARALALCRSCPVQTPCLTHAQDAPEYHGIWGGMTPEQRRGLRRRTIAITQHGTRQGYTAHLRYGEIPCGPCKAANTAIQAAQRRIRQRAQAEHDIEGIS